MSRLSILIAEDEALTRLDIKEMLATAGHLVCAETNNGLKAIELGKRYAPDLAILDVMMPGLDGLEVAKMFHTINIPVVLLTAYSQPKYINRAEKVCVYGYLVKPVKEKDLLPTIQIAYARWREMSEVRDKLNDTEHELQSQKLISKAKALLAMQLGISEYEAHQELIHRAMNNRISAVQLSQDIIVEYSKKAR